MPSVANNDRIAFASTLRLGRGHGHETCSYEYDDGHDNCVGRKKSRSSGGGTNKADLFESPRSPGLNSGIWAGGFPRRVWISRVATISSSTSLPLPTSVGVARRGLYGYRLKMVAQKRSRVCVCVGANIHGRCLGPAKNAQLMAFGWDPRKVTLRVGPSNMSCAFIDLACQFSHYCVRRSAVYQVRTICLVRYQVLCPTRGRSSYQCR